MRPSAALALAASLLLAGCAGGGDGGPGPSGSEEECTLEPVLCDPMHYLAQHPCIVRDVRPRVYAPDTGGPDAPADPWEQGDWWRYRLTVDGQARESLLVYYDDADFAPDGTPQHYLVGAASAEEALDHALFSVNPMLGRIHRALYSPHESGVHADMFAFPLCEGSSWSSTFYGTRFALAARLTPLDLPDGSRDPLGFTISGSAPDGSTLEHTYSPAAKWFTRLALQRADGLRVTMELLAFGSGQSGTFHFLRAQQDEVVDLGEVGSGGHAIHREDGGEGPYTTVGVWIDAERQGSGKVEVLLRDPTGAVRACAGFAGQGPGGALRQGCASGGTLKVQVPYQAGEWTLSVDRPLFDSGTRATGEARVVSIYDRSGSV